MQDAPRSVDHVIVLMAVPGKAELSDDLLAHAIGAVGMFMPELRWLEERRRGAAEIAFTPPPPSHFNPRSLEDRLRGRFLGLPVDVAVLPLGGRRKRLVITDVGERAPGAEVLARGMARLGGRALLGVAELPQDAPSTDEVLAAVRGAKALGLFEGAGLRVAHHADEAVGTVADARIMHNDLRALMYLQGCTAEQFS